MAIAFDAATAGGTTTGSQLTFAHTCTGSNRYLFVVVNYGNAVAPNFVSYAGVNMTQLYQSGATTNRVYYLANPTSGTNNVIVDWGGSGGLTTGAIAVSYTGMYDLSQPDSSGTEQTGNPVGSLSASTTTIINNDWIIGFAVTTSSSTLSAGTGTTIRTSQIANSTRISVVDSNGAITPPGSASVAVNLSPSASIHLRAFGYRVPPVTYSLTCSPGGFVLTGYAASFYRGIQYVLSAATGSFALTGQALSFIYRTYTRFVNLAKTALTPSNTTKPTTMTATNQSKNSSTWTNQTKN